MPKEAPSLPLPNIRLDTTAKRPLHHQLYEQLSQAIRTGDLKPGTRLPSTRALADERGELAPPRGRVVARDILGDRSRRPTRDRCPHIRFHGSEVAAPIERDNQPATADAPACNYSGVRSAGAAWSRASVGPVALP